VTNSESGLRTRWLAAESLNMDSPKIRFNVPTVDPSRNTFDGVYAQAVQARSRLACMSAVIQVESV